MASYLIFVPKSKPNPPLKSAAGRLTLLAAKRIKLEELLSVKTADDICLLRRGLRASLREQARSLKARSHR